MENFDNYKLKIVGTTNYFMISHDGGTGGGIFRKMYGDFYLKLLASQKFKISQKLETILLK